MNFSLNWTGPRFVFAVGPSPSGNIPDSSPPGVQLLRSICFFFLLDMLGTDVHPRTSPARGTPYATPNHKTICRIFSDGSGAICARQHQREIPPIPRHSGRHFDTSLNPRNGQDHQLSVCSRSKRVHRGNARGTLDWTVSPILGTEK